MTVIILSALLGILGLACFVWAVWAVLPDYDKWAVGAALKRPFAWAGRRLFDWWAATDRYPDLPEQDYDTPLQPEPEVEETGPIAVRPHYYAKLHPPADPDVWTDPHSVLYREDLHQFCAEFSMRCAAQHDAIARRFAELDTWLEQRHEAARVRLGLTKPGRRRDARTGRFVKAIPPDMLEIAADPGERLALARGSQ